MPKVNVHSFICFLKSHCLPIITENEEDSWTRKAVIDSSKFLFPQNHIREGKKKSLEEKECCMMGNLFLIIITEIVQRRELYCLESYTRIQLFYQ